MPEEISIQINGRAIVVPAGITVAVAVTMAGDVCRTSVGGEARGVLCGMGICFECRVMINGRTHCRSCQIVCAPGMEVVTGKSGAP